jgi:glycosyltransferase involved in cell wall biosynthesis
VGVSEGKIHVIPNAIDPARFRPDISGAEIRERLTLDKELVIGFVGSFVSWSNLESLVEVFSDIFQERPDTHLMLVGDGPMRRSIEDILAKKAIENKITLTGNISHADIPSFIAAMNICVIPQSNEYRSPVKLFEYMAMGKPVVAPRLEPIEKVVTHKKNGILFEQDGILVKDSMKDAIMYLLKNGQKRRKLGEMACRSVLESYTWSANAEKIMKIYDQISNRNATRINELC